MKPFYKQYIGSRKIINLELIHRKTLLGREVYLVTYKDETQEELPRAVIEQCATKSAGDATQLRELRVKPTVEKMMGILVENDLRLEDVQYTIQKLDDSVEESIKKATTKFWGKEFEDRRMSDVERVLKG